MVDKRAPGPNDAELLTRVAFIPTAEAAGTELGITIPERAAHLVETLNHFDSLVLVEGDIRMYRDDDWRKAQQERFGQYAAYEMQTRKYQKHQDLLIAARREFDAAYGLNLLFDADSEHRAAIQADADEQYAAFERQFRGSTEMRMEKRHQMRTFYREQILGETITPQAVEPVEPADVTSLELTDKVSLITALRPPFVYRYMGRTPEDYSSVTENDVRRAHPSVIRPALVSKKKTSENSLALPDDVGGKVYATFSPAEYPSILRTDPKFPAVREMNRSERAQRNKPQDERDSDAPRRASIHVNERIGAWMTDYTANVLDPSVELIQRFREASQWNGGLARFGNVMNMQAQLGYLWDNIVGDMLWTARVALNESPEWEEQRRLGMEKAVYFAETPAAQLQNFNTVLDLADEWIQLKKTYLAGRGLQIARFIYRLQTPEERNARSERLPASA